MRLSAAARAEARAKKCSERKLKMVIWYHVEVAYQITDFIGQFFEL